MTDDFSSFPKAKDAPSKSGFSLRPATEDDVVQLLGIETAVHTVAPWTEENLRAEMAKPYSHFLVMTDDETDATVAGYIVFWLMFDECQILNVAVDFPFRGLGLAKQMVRLAATQAHRKGLKKVLLDVRKSNAAAIQLYQSVGFVVTHVRAKFYSNGEDAYQMALFMEEDKPLDF
jgi:ribosomal-protein-alanine N-acetyltransferase